MISVIRKNLLCCFFIAFAASATLAQNKPAPTPQWRPVYHFTPAKNWTNDPNGLVYVNGVFHLYNQQNPYENKWGHMSWGHAVSRDLVHWKHLPIAIPEVLGKNDTTWIFSGCAVWDKQNTSGFCKNGGCIVAVYTADQPHIHKESQFVAFSNDGGMTFTNYKGNPVIDLHRRDFRDPNVSWNEQLHKWLMVVALPGDEKVRFYASPDLKDWKLLSDFGPAGLTTGIWECPTFIQLPVQGTNRKKWILMTSFGGGSKPMMQYFVGDFDGKNFINDNPASTKLLVDDGDCFYAAIPWNNVPHDKKILIGWLTPRERETYPWQGQMSIPRDLSLVQTKEGLRLAQQPASIIKNNLGKLSKNNVFRLNNKKVTDQEIKIGQGHSENAYWIETELVVGKTAKAGFYIAQKKDNNGKTISATAITYDPAKHQLYVDKSHSGDDRVRKEFAVQTIDLPGDDGNIQLEILVDKSSLEVFVNKGTKVLSTHIFPGEGATGLSFFAKDGTAEIRTLKLWDLSAIK